MKKNIHKENKIDILILISCILIFLICAFSLRDKDITSSQAADHAEYEKGRVIEILSDTTFADETADGGYRGEQMLTAEVLSGRYKGETMLVYNYCGPLYGVPVKANDRITMIISTYVNGDHTASVYEYDRLPGILILTAVFVAMSILIGGKNGARSLLGLMFIVLNLYFVLLPSLMKGGPTIPVTFAVCVFVSLFSFTAMSGFNKKTLCAFLGTVCGLLAAFLFARFAQTILRIDGLRAADIEALLQLRNTGVKIGLKGLLSAGIIISSLGAIMDATMGLASAISEVHDADPQADQKKLFLSGMNVGKDMVGTMTSTLVLAFIGSSLVLILYLYSLDLGRYQFISSAYFSIEVVSSLSSSIGVISSVPITAAISAHLFNK